MTIIDGNLKGSYKRRPLLRPSSVDRLTSLPNDLLTRILTILPTKDAAATQVVSKRMKQAAFCWITSIDLDNSHVLHCVRRPSPNLVEKFSLFESFTDNLLLHKLSQSQQPLTRFKLCLDGNKTVVGPLLPGYHKCSRHCSPNLEPSRLYAWISYPLAHCGLRELDLSFHVRNSGQCKLPPGLFACQSLEVLRLDSNLEINGGVDDEIPLICLPNLKILHLFSLVFTDDDFVTRLVSNCPVLEDLALNYCMWVKADRLVITSNSLRRLACLVYKYNNYKNSEVLIDTPNLEFISYMDNFPWRCSITHMNSLVKACINLVSINSSFQINLSFLRAVSYVQHLALSKRSLETFMTAGELKNQLPMFHNLKTLKLSGLRDSYYHGLRWDIVLLPILHSTPMLETVVFSQGFFVHHNDRCVVSDREDSEIADLEAEGWRTTNIPSCFQSHLRQIVINSPCGCDRELNMMKFLLGSASILKELFICYSKSKFSPFGIRFDGHNADQFKKTLEELPKASNSCSIMHCDDESTFIGYLDLYVI